ncbi:MAG: hypothetical protein ACI3Z0_02415 [Candidatus Cryptobacteroides sp.]
MSLAIFPFFFSFLPGVNTKMMMAIGGLYAFVVDCANNYNREFIKRLSILSLWALGVSFCSLLTMVYNDTPDDSYLMYIVSMWVWLFAVYFPVHLIRLVHGSLSVEKIGYYLLGVALLQCTVAILIHQMPVLQNLFNQYITGEKYMGVGVGNSRLFGIGCALDVGGGRLGAILIITTYLILQALKRNDAKWKYVGLLIAFLYVLVCGNMMGRTTTVGAILAISYGVFSVLTDKNLKKSVLPSFAIIVVMILVAGTFLCVILYNFSPEIKRLIRFAFEGFFNYFENGIFETNSTNMLSEGLIFPDNTKTWIIGDGYMASGLNDPYYLGPSDYGFYMNTDAGYSRFIFYFGLIGLTTFSVFFINVCKECVNRLKNARWLFITLLLLHFCIWVKASTDLFLMFAPFLCFSDDAQECDNEG